MFFMRNPFLALFQICVTICFAASYFILSLSIVPTQKYLLDRNIRQRFSHYDSLQSIPSVWKILESDLINFNFRDENLYESVSSNEAKFTSDRMNFRIGPARLYQFRKSCQYFDPFWQLRNGSSIAPYEFESPLSTPWFFNNQTLIPRDWIPSTIKIENFRGCGFESEIGVSMESAKFVLKDLKKQEWITQETMVLFFEQSYFNANLNAIFQQREK